MIHGVFFPLLYFYCTCPCLSVVVSFCLFLFVNLEDKLLVILWTDILAFSLHVKLLLNCFTLCENLSHSLFFVVWYMPLECLHNGLGLTLSDTFLIHMHVGIWFRQFCSVSLRQMSPAWTVFVDTPFWACIPFHCSTAHYKPLSWKTMIIPTLGNCGALKLFWEWVLN